MNTLGTDSNLCEVCRDDFLTIGGERRCVSCAPYLRCPDCGASVVYHNEAALWLCDGAECAWAATEAPWNR